MTETTPRFALPTLQSGQAQKELYHNEALALLDIALQATVQSASVNAPPTDPAIGDCWIVGPSPSGSWLSHAGEIAGWTSGGWRFVHPPEGMTAWCIEDTIEMQHLDGVWIAGCLRATSVWIAGRQILGGQAQAIAMPTSGETVDAEARTTILKILAALTAHGLIAA